MERLKQARDVRVRWMSYELRPEREYTPEEQQAMAAYKQKVAAGWPRVVAMAETYGLKFGARNANSKSRLALEAAKFAEDAGRDAEYVPLLFSAHFVEGRDLSDRAVLVELAQAAGMDGAALDQALRARDYKTRVEQELALGFMYRLSGVPAFIIGSKYLVTGAQPLELLTQVVDKCIAEGATV
ncbi:MAG: DsbA family protein [Chloroflexi bacterium]|nr:DsbA family protein [Chloroflexota bacterium]